MGYHQVQSNPKGRPKLALDDPVKQEDRVDRREATKGPIRTLKKSLPLVAFGKKERERERQSKGKRRPIGFFSFSKAESNPKAESNHKAKKKAFTHSTSPEPFQSHGGMADMFSQ